jgi:hypothetical protein
MTKLLARSKSTTSVDVWLALIFSGCESSILMPDWAALGNMIPGLLVPLNTFPFLSEMLLLEASMIRRNP